MFENREGKRVPDVKFRTRQESEWVDLTSGDVFAGKTVVVFSLPGAFTPTCSSSHVPRFNKLASKYKGQRKRYRHKFVYLRSSPGGSWTRRVRGARPDGAARR